MIFTSAWLMGVPRLGDDAMLYVSKGVGFYGGYNHGTPLARSINEQLGLQDNLGGRQKQINWRVSGQALGGATFTHDVLTGLVYKLLGNAKWTFAFMETVTAITMTLCFSVFLMTFFGAEAAGLAMLLLSFLLLPAQGIHYLIPSTLALSLGLLAISAASERPEARRTLSLLAFPLAFLHNMAYVWLCIAWAVGSLELWKRRKPWLDACGLGAALLSPIALKTVLVSKVEYFSLPYRALAPPAPDRLTVFRTNLSAFSDHFARQDTAFTVYWILALAAAACYFAAGRLNEKQKALTGLFLLMLGLALGVHLPFYPAEVAFRVFTALAVPLTGIFSCAALERCRTSSLSMKRAFTAAVLGFILVSASQFNGYVFANVRPFVIRDEEYRKALSRLDPAADSLLFLETEYSFRQSVINQDRKFRSYQWPLLSSQKLGVEFLAGKRPNILLFPAAETLNTANLSARGRWLPRQLGLSSVVVGGASIGLDGKSAEPVEISIKNTRAETAITVLVGTESKTFSVAARSQTRVEIEPRGQSRIALTFAPGARVWLNGIKRGRRASPGVLWPWGENITLAYTLQPGDAAKSRKIDFSLDALLKEWDGEPLSKRIKSFQPLSDVSGVVVAKVEWK